MPPTHLIISHPDQDSFNYTLHNAAFSLLSDHNQNDSLYQTDVYHLYCDHHPAVIPYGIPIAPDSHEAIKLEQNKVRLSHLVIMQFPIYWFSLPALLKIYWERILELGFAYPGKFEQSPLFGNKKILFSVTTKSTRQEYSKQGKNGTIKENLFHLATTFRFVGFDILEPFVAYDVPDQTPAKLAQLIEDYQGYLHTIIEKPKIWLTV